MKKTKVQNPLRNKFSLVAGVYRLPYRIGPRIGPRKIYLLFCQYAAEVPLFQQTCSFQDEAIPL